MVIPTLSRPLVTDLAGRDVVNVLAGVALGLLTVNEVQTLGLGLTVDESTSKTGHELLGLGVAGGRACH